MGKIEVVGYDEVQLEGTKRVFIADEHTRPMVMNIPEVAKLSKQLARTDSIMMQRMIVSEIEDIIKEKYNCDEVIYAD